jgi:cytochrome P450
MKREAMSPQSATDPSFDPLAAADAVPHAELAELRSKCPVALTPSGYWYVSRHEPVVTASRDVLTFEGSYIDTDELAPDELFLPFIAEPRHGRVRRVINAAIAAHRLGRIEAPLRDLCSRLLDPIVEAGRAEFIQAYIEPIPAAGIGFLLGLPDADHPRFSRWADELFRGTVLSPPEEQVARARAMHEISEYLDAAIATRAIAEDPPDDFITRLVNTEVAGERLSHLACRTQLIFLLVAGTETTRNLIGNMTLTLARHPDLLVRLRRHPEEIPAAIEESLRIDPPLPFLLRRGTADVSIAGVHLKAGSQVAFGLASANRDTTVWDDPDTFVIDRENARRHMSFGDGPHVCPGAALARLEARVAIETLVDRVDHLELEKDFVYHKTSVPFTNGPQTLPIRLG